MCLFCFKKHTVPFACLSLQWAPGWSPCPQGATPPTVSQAEGVHSLLPVHTTLDAGEGGGHDRTNALRGMGRTTQKEVAKVCGTRGHGNERMKGYINEWMNVQVLEKRLNSSLGSSFCLC